MKSRPVGYPSSFSIRNVSNSAERRGSEIPGLGTSSAFGFPTSTSDVLLKTVSSRWTDSIVAGRILGQHIAENLLARTEPERVQHGDAARQIRLHGGCTRIRKIYVADL